MSIFKAVHFQSFGLSFWQPRKFNVMPGAVGTDMENLTKDSSVKWRLLFKLCFFSLVIGTVIFIKSKDGMRGSSTYNPYYSQPEKINPYSKYPIRPNSSGQIFPLRNLWVSFLSTGTRYLKTDLFITFSVSSQIPENSWLFVMMT